MVVTRSLSDSVFYSFRPALKDRKRTVYGRFITEPKPSARELPREAMGGLDGAEYDGRECFLLALNAGAARESQRAANARKCQYLSQCSTSCKVRFSMTGDSAGYPTGMRQISRYSSGAPTRARIESA